MYKESVSHSAWNILDAQMRAIIVIIWQKSKVFTKVLYLTSHPPHLPARGLGWWISYSVSNQVLSKPWSFKGHQGALGDLSCLTGVVKRS